MLDALWKTKNVHLGKFHPEELVFIKNFFIEDKSEIARIDPTARSYVLFNLKPKCDFWWQKGEDAWLDGTQCFWLGVANNDENDHLWSKFSYFSLIDFEVKLRFDAFVSPMRYDSIKWVFRLYKAFDSSTSQQPFFRTFATFRTSLQRA